MFFKPTLAADTAKLAGFVEVWPVSTTHACLLGPYRSGSSDECTIVFRHEVPFRGTTGVSCKSEHTTAKASLSSKPCLLPNPTMLDEHPEQHVIVTGPYRHDTRTCSVIGPKVAAERSNWSRFSPMRISNGPREPDGS